MRLVPAASIALLLGASSVAVLAPTAASAYGGFEISVGFAPPLLPAYDQPPIPAEGYIWTPGYWAWDDDFGDYYWVPGTWVLPPQVGYYWTPGYWGFDNGQYVFYDGYWGPQVGFYGGVDYGFGYNGYGYGGGEWRGGRFFYNRSVNNIDNRTTLNLFDRPVANGRAPGRVSFNGPGGVHARPTPQQQAFAHAPHIGVTPLQQQHIQSARSQPNLRATVNHGAPPIAATVRPGLFRGPGLAPATSPGAPYVRPAFNGPRADDARGPGAVQGSPQYRPGNNRTPPTPGDYQGGRPNAFAPTVHYGIPPQPTPPPSPAFAPHEARPGPMMGQPPQVGMRAPPVARPATPPQPPAHPQPPKDEHRPDHP